MGPETTQLPVARETRSFVARQPILDGRLRVHGYELLFRNGLENRFSGDREIASTKVIADGCLLFDLETLAGGRLAFFNVTRDVLLQRHIHSLPFRPVVVELLEEIEPDDEVIAACEELREAGYRVALDDFVFHPGYERFLAVADYVKVDVLQDDPERAANAILQSGFRPTLLAEKVETDEVFRRAQRAGYSLFQGFFFSKPAVMSQRDIPGRRNQLLGILQEIHRPELDFDELEQIIRRDVALCFKLLRYINSANHALRHPVDSVHRALVLLGEQEIRRWVTLVVISTLGQEQPPELIRQALIRARFCEQLALPCGLESRGSNLFLTGMFSVLDTILGRSMPDVLATLPVEDEIRSALLGEQGLLTPVYRMGLNYERGDWERVGGDSKPLNESLVAGLYVDAVRWGSECYREGEDA